MSSATPPVKATTAPVFLENHKNTLLTLLAIGLILAAGATGNHFLSGRLEATVSFAIVGGLTFLAGGIGLIVRVEKVTFAQIRCHDYYTDRKQKWLTLIAIGCILGAGAGGNYFLHGQYEVTYLFAGAGALLFVKGTKELIRRHFNMEMLLTYRDEDNNNIFHCLMLDYQYRYLKRFKMLIPELMNGQNDKGETPLDIAVDNTLTLNQLEEMHGEGFRGSKTNYETARKEILQRMEEYRSKGGDTLLHEQIRSKSYDEVLRTLELVPSLAHVATSNGTLPLDLAIEQGFADHLIESMQERGCKQDECALWLKDFAPLVSSIQERLDAVATLD